MMVFLSKCALERALLCAFICTLSLCSIAQVEICGNSIDDDLDGLIDQNDPDCLDSDNDGVRDFEDVDCDNDGIPDFKEIDCTQVPYDMIVWSHNGSDGSAPTLFQPALIDTFGFEKIGGLLPYNYQSSVLLLGGVSSNREKEAINNNHFLSYAIKPSQNAGAMKVTAVEIGRIAVPGIVEPNHFGYSISVHYSNDGFVNSLVLCDSVFIDQQLPTSYERIDIPMRFDHILLEPNVNYEFRVYLYGHVGSGDISFDDFKFLASECNAALDQDNDGIKNWLDLDSDNDGAYDVIEAGWSAASSNGRLSGPVDAFGLPLSVSNGQGVSTASPRDLDGDVKFDFVDLDTDGDGCYDVLELGIPDQDFDGIAGFGAPNVNTQTGTLQGAIYYNSGLDENQNGINDHLEVTSPTMSCAGDTTVNAEPNKCYALFFQEQPEIRGYCGGLSLISTNANFGTDTLSVGQHQINWNYEDQEGNQFNCSRIVTVIDTEAPIAVCANNSFDLNGQPYLIITPQHIDMGSGDNCGVWTKIVQPSALSTVGPHNVQFVVGDALGYTDTCTAIITITDTISSVILDLRATLEGPYEHSVGIMNDKLRVAGLIPLSSPYYELGFTDMPESELLNPSVLTKTGPEAVVDWVLIELRDAQDAYVVHYQKSGLLLRNGKIVETDGVSPLRIHAEKKNYFVAVRHRNHLGIMTPHALDLTVPQIWDFSAVEQNAWGLKPTFPIATKWVMWSGNASNDGKLSYNGIENDRDIILDILGGTTTATLQAYSVADINMDGIIQYTGANNDRDIILKNIGDWNPLNVRIERLP